MHVSVLFLISMVRVRGRHGPWAGRDAWLRAAHAVANLHAGAARCCSHVACLGRHDKRSSAAHPGRSAPGQGFAPSVQGRRAALLAAGAHAAGPVLSGRAGGGACSARGPVGTQHGAPASWRLDEVVSVAAAWPRVLFLVRARAPGAGVVTSSGRQRVGNGDDEVGDQQLQALRWQTRRGWAGCGAVRPVLSRIACFCRARASEGGVGARQASASP